MHSIMQFILYQEHILYSRQERSIDLCPLDHIDSENSTVAISISTFSEEEVDINIKVRIKGRGIDWIQTRDNKYWLHIQIQLFRNDQIIWFQWNFLHKSHKHSPSKFKNKILWYKYSQNRQYYHKGIIIILIH